MGFFEEEKKEDWKNYLGDDDRMIIEGMLNLTKRFRGAYEHAENPPAAQIWTYLTLLKKEIDEIKQMLGKIEASFQAVISVGEAEKKKTIERLVTEMIRPVDAETQEATKKLVESLMKF